MNVRIFMAQSVNGMIAREDFSEDFLADAHWDCFLGQVKEAGCFVVGRETYETVKSWKEFSFDSIKATKIVISSDKSLKLDKGFTLATSPADALKKAKEKKFANVVVTGGGGINAAFMKQGLVNELVLNIEPFVLGKGIHIFSEDEFECRLKLVSVKKLKEGILQLRYNVTK
jgi:dihydrofolate reductase